MGPILHKVEEKQMKFQTFLNEAKLNDNFKDVDDVMEMLNTVEYALNNQKLMKILKNADKETGNTSMATLRQAITAVKDLMADVDTLYDIDDGIDLFA